MSDFTNFKSISANIQAGSSTRGYHDYVARSWSHVLPIGGKRTRLDEIAVVVSDYDFVGLNEADPGSLRSGFRNQTHYIAEQAGFAHWSHQTNRSVGGVASSANGLLSKMEPTSITLHSLPGRIAGRGLLVARYGNTEDALTIAVCHLSLGAQSRSMQLDFITEILSGTRNAILMGDFNCGFDRPEVQRLFAQTSLVEPESTVLTFPSWKPQRCIDHILISDSLRTSNLRALAAAYSDHLAIAMDLSVPTSALV